MDINQDIDSLLLQQFSCIQTQDREVLVSELQKVIGNHLSAKECEFFLDMSNWNLQGAVWSYFEFSDGQTVHLPKMCLVHQDSSIPTATNRQTRTVLPGQTFTQTWRIMNNGTDRWPPGCFLKHFSGCSMASVDQVQVAGIEAGGITDVTLDMVAPLDPGSYNTQWKMVTPMNTYFGELLCVGVVVSTTLPVDDDVSMRFSSLTAHDPALSQPTPMFSQSEPSIHLNNQSQMEESLERRILPAPVSHYPQIFVPTPDPSGTSSAADLDMEMS